MPLHSVISMIFLLAIACHAQSSSRTALADLILGSRSSGSDIDSTGDSDMECGGILGDDKEALAIQIYAPYTPDTCYDVAKIYSNDTIENKEGSMIDEGRVINTCHPRAADGNCTNDYLVQAFNHYSPPTTNFSLTRFTLHEGIETQLAEFTLKVFAGTECDANATEPWFSWGGCEEPQGFVCRELPYSVRSFRIEKTAEEDLGDCKLAAERGTGVRGMDLSFAAIVGAFVAGILVAT